MKKTSIHAEPAPTLRRPQDAYIGIGVAGLLVCMLVAQLFTFEKLVPLLADLGIGGGEPAAQVVASVLVIAELLALPFLLRMRLSPLMRLTSMASGWIVAATWLYMSIVSIGVAGSHKVGYFGSIIPIKTGWLAVIFALVLAGVLLWATAVLWPGARHIKTRKK